MVPYSLCFEKIYIVEKGPGTIENEQCLFSDDLSIRLGALQPLLPLSNLGAGGMSEEAYLHAAATLPSL